MEIFQKLKKEYLIKPIILVNNNLNLTDVLIKTKKLGFYRIFLEAGMKLTLNFLHNNLVDDLKLFISNENFKLRLLIMKTLEININKNTSNFLLKL